MDGLRFLDEPKGKTFALNFAEVRDLRKAFDAWKADGATGKELRGSVRPGMGLLIEPRAVGDREEWSVSVPAPPSKEGVLRLTLVVSAMKPMPDLPNPRLWVRIGGRNLDYREITGTLDRPHRLVYEVQIGDLVVQPKGVTIALANKVEIPYAVEGFENDDRTNPKDANPPPGGTGLFRPVFNRKALPPEKQPAPYIVLQRSEIEPTAVTQWPPKEWKANVAVKDTPEAAKQLLALWMECAWRRPVSEVEQAPFIKLYEKLRADGMSFDAALRAAFQSVLMSVPFRYMASPGHPDAVGARYALASRLSFMFWGAAGRRITRPGQGG